jgi:hypothetical protein
MKKFLLSIIVISGLVACQNNSGHNHEHAEEAPKTHADSLYQEIMDLHDAVMPKMGKVRGSRDQAQQLLDSIHKLPAKVQAGTASYQLQLEGLSTELNNADVVMDNWMMQFNMDTLANDYDKRVEYLNSEKLKVLKVKEAVLSGLAKADSLLKK